MSELTWSPYAVGVMARLCVVWGGCVAGHTVNSAALPLILKDIVGSVGAAWWSGVFFSTTALCGCVFGIAVGHVSDRIGRVLVLLPWIGIFFMASVVTVIGDVMGSVWWLWMGRIAALSVPSSTIFALCGDVLPASLVLQSHGFLGATFGASLLIGSLTSGIVSRLVSRVAALVLGCCFTLAALVAGLLLTLIYTPNRSTSSESVLSALTTVLHRDALLSCVIVSFSLFRVANVNSYMMFTLYTNYRYDWGIFENSMLIGVIGMLVMLWQTIGIRLIMKRTRLVPILLAVVTLGVVVMILYGLAKHGTAIVVVGTVTSVSGVASSIYTTKLTILASESNTAGMALGAVVTLQNALEMLSGYVFGSILARTIASCAPTDFCAGTPYFLNALMYGLSAAVLLWGHARYGGNRAAWDNTAADIKAMP